MEKYQSIENWSVDNDNVIYKPGTVFTYQYEYLLDGEIGSFLFKDTSRHAEFPIDPWTVVKKSDTSKMVFDKIELKVLPWRYDRESKMVGLQSRLSYRMVYKDGSYYRASEATGLVENRKNIWMHPPRMVNFRILEITPFPYVKYPLILENEYTFCLNVGSQWGDENWIEWDGSKSFCSSYKVEKLEMVNGVWGEDQCYIISAKCSSDLGISQAKFKYSVKFGFVETDYLLINGARIKLYLENVENL